MLNSDKIQKAWNFASLKHKDQKVPGTELPYLNHLGNVAFETMAAVCVDAELDAELAVLCAILHDTIEDTDATYEEVEQLFGADVADGVNALSKDKSLPDKAAQMADSLKRIKQQRKEVWIVKMADRTTNLQKPPVYWNKEKISSYKQEAELILGELRDASEVISARLQSKIDRFGNYE